MSYPCLHTEGGLIPADIIDEIAAGEAPGQAVADFGLPRGTRLTDEVAAAWADARAYWEAFKRGLARLPEDDPATTVTLEQWMLPLLRSLGYDRTAFQQRAAVAGNSTYAISHRDGPDGRGAPVHIAGFGTDLDRRPPSGRPRLSPHALMQEYLNRTEDLWGIVTNGERFRLLRDSALMTRPAYVEFDLQQMMEGEHFADFGLMYRLVHRTRLPQTVEAAADCLLERYYQRALEQGGRVRDRLRDGVEDALRIFGSGFLRHPDSGALRDRLQDGHLPVASYYRQLLRLVYRLLFLMVSEERNLVGPENLDLADIYRRYYSVARLRDQAEYYFIADERHSDVWQGLRQTFRLYEDEVLAKKLGMHALDGDLFGPHAIPDLDSAQSYNADILRALRCLSLYHEDHAMRRVNYGALDVEELGSVYESLLEYHPVIQMRDGQPEFAFVTGSERKTTGSYYTRPELVQELIKSALEPVIEERLRVVVSTDFSADGENPTPALPVDGEGEGLSSPRPRGDRGGEISRLEQALLSLKVCDPATGSGHFLLAAARRIGRELARVRTGEEHPTPETFREAVRDVIQHCIYGVDKNPLAVDLCKVALWLEGHNKGLPLTFLDHRIKQGDSLVGVVDLNALVEGIPDDAYKPVSGDDPKIASDVRKRNKQEREGQLDLFEQTALPDTDQLAGLWARLNEMPDSDVQAIRRKQAAYEGARAQGSAWWTLWTACNLWTAAFFTPLRKGEPAPTFTASRRGEPACSPREGQTHEEGQTHRSAPTGGEGLPIPTTATIRRYLSQPRAADGRMVGAANGIAAEQDFFHWPLEFPDVFAQGGFDVVLSNPPWERIKLQEQEFFAAYDMEIAGAPNKAARDRLIKRLPKSNPGLWQAYQRAKYDAEAASRFVRTGNRFPLTAVGDVNTYTLFVELSRELLNDWGRVGIVCPPGIASDDTTKVFFSDLMDKQSLVSLIAFVNEKFIFPGVLHNFRFCALTLAGPQWQVDQADFVYECQTFQDIQQPERYFTLSKEDLALLNPNTRTAPVFRSHVDAELTKKIYRRVPVLIDETEEENPWNIQFMTMFHMSNDAGLFRTEEQLVMEGYILSGNSFSKDSEIWLPLYESKMIHQFDHRFASFENCGGKRVHMLPETTVEQHQLSNWYVLPYYFIHQSHVEARLADKWQNKWLMIFRGITSKALERSITSTILPEVGVSNSAPVLLTSKPQSRRMSCLLANLNSLVFDYVARQKISGANLNFFILKQLPVLSPTGYTDVDLQFIVPRVLELVYTAWDIKGFADDVWREALTPDPSPKTLGEGGKLAEAIRAQWEANRQATGGHVGTKPPGWIPPSVPPWTGGGNAGSTSATGGGNANSTSATGGGNANSTSATGGGNAGSTWDAVGEENCSLPVHGEGWGGVFPYPPFKWDEDRRAVLRAELDAYYARLYGLTEEELRYILDPADVYGPDFPGETFRVLKEKEIKQYGEYRTRRLVLEAWERLWTAKGAK